MLISRRRCLTGMAAVGLAPVAASAQQPYPSGLSIKVIVLAAAGGSIDVVGRIVADRLAAMWGVPVVVENVPGGMGNIAHDRVAKGHADGTQLLMMATPIVTNQFLQPHLTYDPERDFIPLSCVARMPNLLVVKKNLPAGSVTELIAYAKANPGRLNYGSPGTGSSIHLSAELSKRMTGTEMAHVAYRGSGQVMNDLVAGQGGSFFDPERRMLLLLAREGADGGVLSSLQSRVAAIANEVCRSVSAAGNSLPASANVGVQVVVDLPRWRLVPVEARSAWLPRSMASTVRRWLSPAAVVLAVSGAPAAASVNPGQYSPTAASAGTRTSAEFGVLSGLTAFAEGSRHDTFAAMTLEWFFGGAGRATVGSGIPIAQGKKLDHCYDIKGRPTGADCVPFYTGS